MKKNLKDSKGFELGKKFMDNAELITSYALFWFATLFMPLIGLLVVIIFDKLDKYKNPNSQTYTNLKSTSIIINVAYIFILLCVFMYVVIVHKTPLSEVFS